MGEQLYAVVYKRREETTKAAFAYLALFLDKLRDYNSRMTRWHVLREVIRYDRSTGFFSVFALPLAARGMECQVGNRGRMRLIVGCTLTDRDLAAIQKGEDLRDTVDTALLATPLQTEDGAAVDALELVAWMVAKQFLDVKVAVPRDGKRRPHRGRGTVPREGGHHQRRQGQPARFQRQHQ
jgi:hypothetical protein